MREGAIILDLKWNKLILGCLVLIEARNGFAAPMRDLMEYLNQEIDVLDHALASCSSELDDLDQPRSTFQVPLPGENPPEGSSRPDEQLQLRTLWVRFRPKVGFSLPGLVGVQVIPEVEVLWQRGLPDGWELYHP